MADNDSATAPVSQNSTDNVTIRIIALAHATQQNENTYLVMSLDCTISELKNRLQQELSQHPRPDSQRLIYHGRHLTDGNATLRQTLRLESTSAGDPPVHAIHLVIRDDQPPVPTNTGRPQPAQAHGAPTTGNVPPQPHQSVQNPGIPAFSFAQPAFPQGHPAQNMLREAMRQHMAIHNHHHQTFPGGAPTGFPVHTPGLQQNTTQASPQGMPAPTPLMARSPNTETTPPFAGTVPHANNQMNVIQGSMTIHETIGPNGERTRRVVQNGPIFPGHINPVERPASAPGVRQPNPLAQSRFPGSTPAPPVPLPFLPPSLSHNHQQPFGRLPTVPVGATGSAYAQHGQQAQNSRNHLLYLISSPSGPEAVLFAPPHGYYRSGQSNATGQVSSQTQTTDNSASNQTNQPTPTQPPTPPNPPVARNNEPGQIALRPQAVANGRPLMQAGGREGEDLIALVLQRGWLFLRLYMFIFVLSEPGTWRRYILLTIASLVCLLPQNNPFTDMFQAARRHFDNLIGPPAPPPNRGQAQQGANQPTPQNNNGNNPGGGDGTNTSTTVAPQPGRANTSMPTPAEHARRLLREHEQRNPNIIRDTIYRIEQAAALFLASLVPGVGERHVRAREEARRVVQEEEQRLRQEEEERQRTADDANKADGTPAVVETGSPTESAQPRGSSTGVDVPHSDGTQPTDAQGEGLRLRNAENSASPPG